MKDALDRATWPFRCFIFIGFFTCCNPWIAIAIDSSGTSGAPFLEIPVGGVPAALGGAYSALAADAYAPIWNPGGLGFLDSTQLAAQHLSYIDNVNYEYASFVRPLGQGRSLGASIQYLTSGDIPATNDAGQSLGNYSNHFGAYSISYGQTLGDRLAVGLTGKMINEKLGDASANAYAADAGGLYRARENMDLALVVANVGSRLTFLDTSDPLPLNVRIGGAWRLDRQWTLSLEGVYSHDNPPSLHTGMQWKPFEIMAIRAGYETGYEKELSLLAGFSTGIGLEVWGQELAYAWLPYGDLGNTQYFSLLIRFGDHNTHEQNLQKADRKRVPDNLYPDLEVLAQ